MTDTLAYGFTGWSQDIETRTHHVQCGICGAMIQVACDDEDIFIMSAMFHFAQFHQREYRNHICRPQRHGIFCLGPH